MEAAANATAGDATTSAGMHCHEPPFRDSSSATQPLAAAHERTAQILQPIQQWQASDSLQPPQAHQLLIEQRPGYGCSTPACADLRAQQPRMPSPQSAPAQLSRPQHGKGTLLAWLSGGSHRAPKRVRAHLAHGPAQERSLTQHVPTSASDLTSRAAVASMAPHASTAADRPCASAPAALPGSTAAASQSLAAAAAQQEHAGVQQQVPASHAPCMSSAMHTCSQDVRGPLHSESAMAGMHMQQQQQQVEQWGARLEVDESDPHPAVCGVRLIWASVEARRRGIATRLLNAARCASLLPAALPCCQLGRASTYWRLNDGCCCGMLLILASI